MKQIPQPKFPDIIHMDGNPTDGFSVVTFSAADVKGGRVAYAAEYKGDVKIKEADELKIAAMMKKFGDKEKVSVDIDLAVDAKPVEELADVSVKR